MNRLGRTDLEVFPLCLGGNVFGWTADEQQSFEVLDAYYEAGGNFIDTADVYSAWVPGHTGGESETIVGRWMKARGNRERMVIATKVGMLPSLKGLAPSTIREAAEASLRRLGVDHIDLYYAHADDPNTPLDETLRGFDSLVRDGKVRYIAASNYTAPRLDEALAVSDQLGLARYAALQTHYNLIHRNDFEGDLLEVCERNGLACLPYYALARGFLSGKYREGIEVDSPRAPAAKAYLDDHGKRVLEALDAIAAEHSTTVAAVALAWLHAQRTVAAPIASARSAAQLAELVPMSKVKLSSAELARLADV